MELAKLINPPGLGIEYEIHLAAYFALLLNSNPEIEDFKLGSNVQDFGNLDDLLVDIKTKSGENLYFAFQLKYKEKSNKNLLEPTYFEAKGDFNLQEYCETFKKLDEGNRKYHLILYTNQNFVSSRTNKVKNFYMRQDEYYDGRNLFDTSSADGKHLYKFEVNDKTECSKNVNRKDYEEFFSKFSLYTAQANIRDLENYILNILKYRECYATYIDFFRKWHRGDFFDKIVNKQTFNFHLVDILLSSVAINCHFSDGQDENSKFFEAMVRHFDITIFDASKQDFIKQLYEKGQKYLEGFDKKFGKKYIFRLAKESKFIDRFTKQLKEETKLKLLHYFFQKPLILDFNESSQNVIYEASKLCRIHESEIKLVILGEDIDISKFSHLTIFTNLTGINGYFLEETKRRCNLTLQGRNISLEAIFEDEIREFVTPREIFQMLKGTFSIGEDKENLPECYIPRTVSTTVFDIESIIKFSSGNVAIIFCYENKFKELNSLIQNIVDHEYYLYEDVSGAIILKPKQYLKRNSQEDLPTIILRKEKCSRKQLDEIREKIGKDDIYSFKIIDGKRCLLLMSTINISYIENYKCTKMSVEENNIHTVFNNSINILCAPPGMGKSTLINYLRNQCDPNFWTLRVDLKAHNQFLKRNHEIEDVLKYLLEVENCQDLFLLYIRSMFLRKEKIVFFLDGLDEIENQCVDCVLNITRLLSEMGFKIWLSSRQNLQQKIQNYFKIFAIEIDEINENQQKKYIENRLIPLYNKNEIEEIVYTIFSNTDLINNRQILEIPLQLQIITQIFLDDKSYYSSINNGNFILTKILEIFFEGKYKHFLAKFESKNHHLLGVLEERLETYEIVALHSVLDDEHFQKLKIKRLKLTQVKNFDFLGIIKEINNKNKAVFEHLTYAEYFASKFLVKNFDKARILREEIFTEKYHSLRIIFNTMLAEDSPLHLAIIYKDLSRIQEMEESSLMDKGGRNLLQVTACVATRHPILECSPSPSEWLVKDESVEHFKGEDLKIKEMVRLFLSSETFKNDKIFGWNSLDYAMVNGALYILEAILEKSEKPPNFCKMLGNYYTDEVVAYYSIRFGYHRLLSEILAKKVCLVTGILSDYLGRSNMFKENSILHLFFGSDCSDCTNRARIIELLTDDDINKIVYNEEKYTFLHFAVLHQDTEIAHFLLKKGADVNVRDKEGKSPLFLAVERNNLEISKLLLECRADVNIKDKNVRSPLFLAVERENLEMSKLLIKIGADVNIKDKNGMSPLFLAVEANNFDISKLLFESGADINIKNNDGWSPLSLAVEMNNLKISKLLVEKGTEVNVKYNSTPGLGIEYEVYVPAYFALLLNTNPEIEDFKLRSNVQDFGNLDDLLVDIKTKSGEDLYFAFQLKHRENSSKNLLPINLEARGNFNLEKYCETFKKLSEENRKNYQFILYTNMNFDSSRTSELKNFCMKAMQDVCYFMKNLFDTSGSSNNLFQFEVNEETEDGKNMNKKDYEEFFSKFSLYTGQANVRDLEKYILDILKDNECYTKYINFFRKWHRGNFTDIILDKKTLNVHLVDILLSSVTINYYLSDGQDGNANFFEVMVQQFDITIIGDFKQKFIHQLEKNIHKSHIKIIGSEEKMIRLAKKSKFIDRFTKELKEETILKLLHYFFQKPLILDFNESSQNLIYEASKLCRIQENEIKLVILGEDIDISKFSHLTIFTNLTGINGYFLEETKRRCNLTLQGRNISLEAIFEDEIREFVTPREIFQMLKGTFSIGEDKENLPECYIPRTVSITVFDIESIIKHSSRSAAIIFCYEDKLRLNEILIKNRMNSGDYLCEYSLDSMIFRTTKLSEQQSNKDLPTIILKKECSRKQLDDIRKKIGKDDIRLFKVIDETRCLMLLSTKNTFKQNYKISKMSVEENNIHIFFNNSINILCAQPGMGKSTLMRYLENECDSNVWTVMVDLKAHSQFLKGNRKIEDILTYFLELENCQDIFLLRIRKMFLEKRKIVLFLDGLDEVSNECVDCVLNIARQLSEMGFRIWLSSRQNLQQKLEHYFNIFAIKIDGINKNQQENYIDKRLKSNYTENEIEEIVEKIFSNTNLENNRQIIEIPLQLHIITQIFIDDKSQYSDLSKNNFILTKIFEIFFDGKYKHYLAKLENPHLLGELEKNVKSYEIVALHSVLEHEHFQKLQMGKLTLTQIKNSDFLGIITEINNEQKAAFVHLTFAEYFASKFLVKNFDKARILKEEIFTEKYQNLFFIFNIMLAEDSPLHLAIIYKDFNRIEEIEESSLVDKGGRTFLQVAACIATRHPLLESYRKPSSSECWVKDMSVQHFKGEDSNIKEIVNRLLSSGPFKNDTIFEWNSLDYALATGALYIVEAILENFEKPPNVYEMLEKYYSDEVVAYYSIRFGYHRLLSEILSKKSCHTAGIVSDYLIREENHSILHFLFNKSDCINRTRIVELLAGDDINKTVYDKAGYTFLHFAVYHEDIEFLEFLLEKHIDVNVTDTDGWTPLYLAVVRENLVISNLLIQNGANLNIKDKYGWSPLRWAVEGDNIEISKLLIERETKQNKTLLSSVITSTKRIFTKNANVNQSKKISQVLRLAAQKGNFNLVKILIENEAIWDAQIILDAIEGGNDQIFDLFLGKGVDLSKVNALHKAVKCNNINVVTSLIKNGTDINVKDEDGCSPLFRVIERNNLEILRLLVEKRTDVNMKNLSGESPLLWAVWRNNYDISKILVEQGAADVNIKDQYGKSPLFWALKQNNPEISKLLVKNGAEVNSEISDMFYSLLLEK